MKMLMKRSLAFLIALVLCLSLLPVADFTAEAASYVYNWGTRGTVATYLSDQAEDFYADNNTSYEELASLSGSTSTSSVPSSTLFKKLHKIMWDNLDNQTSYNGTKELFRYTDCQNSGKTTSKISSFYSGKEIGPGWNSSEWNREHVWPNSKSNSGSDGNTARETDIMMLRPTSISENSSRGNTAYGEGSSFYDPNEEGKGKYDLRGDVARIVLYVYTCWGGSSSHDGALNYMWGSSGVIESKAVLLKWMEADPVDTWELGRNDSVESITGTRNVFVDYPELAFALFNEDVPAGYTSPSGSAAASNYTITAVSGNTAYGTVSLNGKNITASPKTGYYASGYTVTSGTATVTRDGNVFTVSASSDCTIRIDFAPKTAATVTYVQNGETVGQVTGLYVGDVVTLPAHDGNVPEDCTFMGWVTTPVAETPTKPAPLYLKGTEYNTTAATTTFYALYSYVGEGDGTGTGQWTMVTAESQLVAGAQMVIACKEKGTVAGELSNSVLSKVSATFSSNTIPTLPTTAQILTLGGSSGAWTLADQNGRLLGATAVKKLAWGNGSTNWDISVDSDGAATIQNKTSSYGRFLYNNSSPRFTTYTSDTNAGMILPQLYMLDTGAGSTLYSTTIGSVVECDHANARVEEAEGPFCKETGYTAGVYCPDCEEYISGHEVTTPIGHNYGTGDICANCGLEKGRPGDVNYDGEIDSADGLMLLKYLNGWDVDAYQAAMDLNFDRTVNSLDGLMMLRYLNGWEIRLEP